MSSEVPAQFDLNAVMQLVDQAAVESKITTTAAMHIRTWLTDNRYVEYAQRVADHVTQGKWQILDDVFWTIIPFGTGGRRGKMYPIGCNAINARTIGESAQGLATYVRKCKGDGPLSFAIAYDTRHRSREFAELCSSIMVANGFTVYFVDDYRSTPELSLLVRLKKCDCGIMVTASHNPPSDNAVKVYWSTGGQLVPPHDKGVIDEVMQVSEIKLADFQQAVADGKVIMCREEADAALLEQHLAFNFGGARDIKVIYSPLHGVGEFNVRTLLEKSGFDQLEIYQPHREPSGDFPNVPDNVSNPENAAVFTAIIENAQKDGGDLILATDPDCDRMGAAAPLTMDSKGEWGTLTGNQLGALLIDYVLGRMQAQGKVTPDSFTVTTLVTTLLSKRVTEGYGAKCYNENLVGFKWICHVMDQVGAENFVLGTEESYGYLVGQYARDKDGAVACLLISQLAAECRAAGQSLFDRLNQLYVKYGYHAEETISIFMHGSDGMRRMQALMASLRDQAPVQLAEREILQLRDYKNSRIVRSAEDVSTLDGPVGDLVIFDFDQAGNQIAIRPSGTEPKVKFYMFYYQSDCSLESLAACQAAGAAFFSLAEKELRAIADAI